MSNNNLFVIILASIIVLVLCNKSEFLTGQDCSSDPGMAQMNITCSEEEYKELQGVLNIVNEDIEKKQEETKTDTYVDGKKVATKEDLDKAYLYATGEMCKESGYEYVVGKDQFSEQLVGYCNHTYDTCKRDSKDSGNDFDFKYFEWRGNIKDKVSCVYAHSGYKKRCLDKGLTYIERDGKCKPNERYCECKGLEYKDSDCWRDPMSSGAGTVFGNTITQGLNRSLSYKDAKHGCY